MTMKKNWMWIYLDDERGTCSGKLKGKYHANLLLFHNPKMFVCEENQRNNCQVCYKLFPQCNKTVY